MSHDFKDIPIDELYKVPENVKLPEWFEYFKTEELDKVRVELDALGCRLYRSKITESFKSNRKKLEKKIKSLIEELEDKYADPLSLPIEKIN